MTTQADSGWVVKVKPPSPSLNDNTADADRLVGALKPVLKTHAVDVDLALRKTLPRTLRDADYDVRCVCFHDHGRWRLVGVKGRSEAGLCAGIAMDLGTTRVVLRLIDLETGEDLGETAFDNPQIAIGPDILARIHHAATPEGQDRKR